MAHAPPPSSQRRRLWNRILRAVPLLAALALAAWLLWPQTGPSAPADWASLIERVAAGDVAAADAVSEMMRAGSPALQRVGELWTHDAPSVRVLVCRVAGETGAASFELDLLRRTADRDYRVRAAAYAALQTIRSFSEPARDTPIDQRDTLLLDWIGARWGDEPQLVCVLFAEPAHLQVGRPLVAACQTCHAGPVPSTPSASCASCHMGPHDDWAASAHANSLSHLHLQTVEPLTRSPATVTFGERRGIDCAACHAPPAVDATAASRCSAGFLRTNSVGCASCHEQTGREWRAWGSGERPRVANWPPGQVVWRAGGEVASCVDCHMPERDIAGGPEHDHRWRARRDPELLASAIRVNVLPVRPGDDTVEIELINLAGHATPTGVARRAIELRVGGRLVATFAAGTGDAEAASALQPSERRVVGVTLEPGATELEWSLTYVRDLTRRELYSIEFARGRAPAPR